MPAVTLTEGDFGSGVEARADSAALYLPDPARAGAILTVPLSDVAEMETTASDRAGQVKAGLKLSAKGFMAVGPVGLAAGLLAASRVKNVFFSVVLADGRRFVATASAEIYADLHSAQLAARAEEAKGHPADEIIARYIAGQQVEPESAPASSAAAPLPAPAAPPATAAPQPLSSPAADATRPVFGRRRRSDLPPAG